MKGEENGKSKAKAKTETAPAKIISHIHRKYFVWLMPILLFSADKTPRWTVSTAC